MELRELTPPDTGFLIDMLVEAANWSGVERFARHDLEHHPQLWHYVSDWPRTNDFGVLSLDDEGVPTGAAWARTFPAEDPGYGFVAADIPEVSMAVVPAHRGHGVGRRLLDMIIELARRRGWRALSLSVEDGNRAADLYRATGFATVGRNAGSDTMLLDLRL